MLNQIAKISQNVKSVSKLVIGLSILFVTVGLASCAPEAPNSEAENQTQPGQVRDATNEQSQPVDNGQIQQTNPQTTDDDDDKAEDVDKIKQQEEGNTGESYKNDSEKPDDDDKDNKGENSPSGQ